MIAELDVRCQLQTARRTLSFFDAETQSRRATQRELKKWRMLVDCEKQLDQREPVRNLILPPIP
jgi:hypothetical protein